MQVCAGKWLLATLLSLWQGPAPGKQQQASQTGADMLQGQLAVETLLPLHAAMRTAGQVIFSREAAPWLLTPGNARSPHLDSSSMLQLVLDALASGCRHAPRPHALHMISYVASRPSDVLCIPAIVSSMTLSLPRFGLLECEGWTL